jgi:hypothetical protein
MFVLELDAGNMLDQGQCEGDATSVWLKAALRIPQQHVGAYDVSQLGKTVTIILV